MRALITGLTMAVLLAGCVGKGRYELAVVQLEATRKALDARDLDARATLDMSQRREKTTATELAERVVQLRAEQERYEALDAKLRALADTVATMRTALAAGASDGSEEEPVDGVAMPEVDGVAEALASRAYRRAADTELRASQERVREAFESLVADGYATVEVRRDMTVVTLLGAKLFNENRVSLSPLGDELVKRVAQTLAPLVGQRLTIVGHTDNQLLHSTAHPSNWELGFAYAVTFHRGLAFHGSGRTPTLVSRAAADPVATGDDPDARRLNRRVELWIQPDGDVLDAVLPAPPEGGPEQSEPVEVLESSEP